MNFKTLLELRRGFQESDTFTLATQEYGEIGSIITLHKTPSHYFLGCKGDCALRNVLLSAVDSAKPACDLIPVDNRYEPVFYFRNHIELNLRDFMHQHHYKLSDIRKFCQNFLELYVYLTDEVTIKITADGRVTVYNVTTKIHSTEPSFLFTAPQASLDCIHCEGHRFTSADSFELPIIRLRI